MSPAFETMGNRTPFADVLNVLPDVDERGADASKRHKADQHATDHAAKSSIWSLAWQQLRSTMPSNRPPQGREQQYQQLTNLLEDFVQSGHGTSVYVSGVPGTGKTHTVKCALQRLAQPSGAGHTSSCGVMWTNCMSATTVADVCTQAVASLRSSAAERGSTPRQQQQQPQQITTTAELSAELAKQQQRSGRKGKGPTTSCHILVLDEIDHLLASGPQSIYDLFQLPQQPNLRLLVIGIANSIDLTERALPQLKLLGCTPQLLCFPAYTTKQITCILEDALSTLPVRVVERPALELLSRSVSSSSGDLRAAIKTACSALRHAQEQQQQQQRRQRQQDQEQVAPPELQQLGSPGRQRRQQQQQQAKPQQVEDVVVPVSLRDMMAVLAAHTGANGAATAASQLSQLPSEQQLLLYCLCVLCPGASSSSSAAQADMRSLWGLPAAAAEAATGSATDTPPASSSKAAKGTPSGAVMSRMSASGSSSRKRGRMDRAGGSSSSMGLSTTTMESIWQLSLKVVKVVGLAPLSLESVSSQLGLMAQMALVDLVSPGVTGSPAPAATATAGRKLFKPQRLFQQGGRKLGAAAAAAANAAAGGAGGGGGGARAGLRVSPELVMRCFKTHPLFRKLLGTSDS